MFYLKFMADIWSDTIAAFELMRDAYKDLRRKNPNHELLQIATLHGDEEGIDYNSEWERRFREDGDHLKAQPWSRYYFALKEAAK